MPIIFKYISMEILRIFTIVMVVVVAIYLSVDFFERYDDFMEQRVPFIRAVIYFGVKIPFIAAQIFPLGLMLAVIITLGLMNRNNEVLALNSCGVGYAYFFKPVLGCGVLAALLLFFFAEGLVPVANHKANQIWLGEVRKEKMTTAREQDIWIKGDQRFLHIQYIDPVTRKIFGVTLYKMAEPFQLIRRLDAASGEFQEKGWILSDVMEQTYTGGRHQITFHAQLREELGLMPQDITQAVRKSDEMGFVALRKFVQKIERQGYDSAAHRVDLYAKTAFPWICVILSIAGAFIGLHPAIRNRLPFGIVLGIGCAFLYWIFYSTTLTLGHNAALPPLAAAWSANLIFLGVGGLIFFLARPWRGFR